MHGNAEQQNQSMDLDISAPLSPSEKMGLVSKTQPSKPSNDQTTDGPPSNEKQDAELMKERFAKLLLGEDMSGGGKGVSSALALSNAITNLAASVFGEHGKLEPMRAEKKARWRKEIDWLLSVTDHIVELIPSKQVSKDGTSMEVMMTKQRGDLYMNIPALRKLDAMLIGCLDNFKDQNEFSYLSKDAPDSEKGNNKRKDDKWWLPTPKVPPNGLADATRKWLQSQKDSVNQVLKASMAINAQVLSEMEIPESYIESLPKNGKASLGDSAYRSITTENFDPDHFFSTMDLSSDLKIVDLKNRIEASIVIWRRKISAKDGRSSWGSGLSMERRELLEERAETLLHIIKQRYAGIPQSTLEISKIQYNRDVGQAVLESYSRILESLAFTVMSRIEDVMHADSLAREQKLAPEKFLKPMEELEKLNSGDTTISMTLSDFMGWLDENGDSMEDFCTNEDTKHLNKQPSIAVNKKFSYIEKLETLGGLRSPTARH